MDAILDEAESMLPWSGHSMAVNVVHR